MLKVLTFSRFCLLFYFTSLLFASCTSSDDGSNSGEFITANVETLNFKSSNVPDGVTAAKIDGGNSTTYIVQGFDDAGNAIVLVIANFEGPGIYNFSFDDDDNNASGLFSDQNAAWSSAGASGGRGTITVLTDESDETSGRFEFIAVNANNESSKKTVTNGSFRALY